MQKNIHKAAGFVSTTIRIRMVFIFDMLNFRNNCHGEGHIPIQRIGHYGLTRVLVPKILVAKIFVANLSVF